MYPFRVFVSYSHEDRSLAEHVVEVLRAMGLTPDRDIRPSSEFTDYFKGLIAQAHIFMPVITKTSLKRPWVHQDTEYAMAINVPVLPLVVGTIPREVIAGEMIPQLQAISVTDPSDLGKRLQEINFERVVFSSTLSPHSIPAAELLMAKARKALASEDFDTARNELERAWTLYPEAPAILDVLRAIDRAEEEKTRREKVANLLALSQRALSLQDVEEADIRIREALLIDPQNEDAIKLRMSIDQAREEKGCRAKIDALLLKSEQALVAENFEEAAIRAREIFLLDPQNGEANQLLDRISKAQEENHRRDEISARLLLQWCMKARVQRDFDGAIHAAELLRRHGKHQEAEILIREIERERREWERPKAHGVRPRGLPAVPGSVLDRLYFSVTSPPVVLPGSSFVIDVWAHLPQQRNSVVRLARQAAGTDRIHIRSKGPMRIARGTVLSVRLLMERPVVEDPEDTILWEGEIGNATFPVAVPNDATEGPTTGVAMIHINGLQIAKIHFVLQIAWVPSEVNRIPAREKRHRKAFASYANMDTRAALGIQQKGVNYSLGSSGEIGLGDVS